MLGKLAWKTRVTLLSAAAVAAIAAAGVARTDFLLSRGFGKALGGSSTDLSFDTGGRQDAPVQVGDEGYWLTRSDLESSAPFANPLLVGDKITISGRDGVERQLEVVDLRQIGGDQPTRTSNGPGVGRLLLVVCRVAGTPVGDSGATVRFIVEAVPVEPAIPAPAKAL
jgi:hypothetical protein